MREQAFKNWMAQAEYSLSTTSTRVSNLLWIEENVGVDLDAEYAHDKGADVMDQLAYSSGIPHPLKYVINGNPYTNLNMYRCAARLYFKFCSGRPHTKRKQRSSQGWKTVYPRMERLTQRSQPSRATNTPPERASSMEEISELWKDYMDTTEKITKALGRTANIVGEYAERLAAEHYDGGLLGPSNRSADIELPDGKLVQVKSRVPRQTQVTSLSPIRSWDFDLLVVILFNPDGSLMRAIEIPADAARSHARRDAHQNSDLIVTSEEFMADTRGTDITAQLSRIMERDSMQHALH